MNCLKRSSKCFISIFLWMSLLCLPVMLSASGSHPENLQQEKITVTGTVVDATTGETVI